MKVVAALVTGVAAGAALWASAHAQQSPPPSPKPHDSIRVDPNADALQPWTDERMRNAKEMKPPVIDLPALRLTPTPPPAPPIPPQSGRFANPTDLADGKLLPSERAGDPSTYPLRWAGRLFAQMPANGNWQDVTCSAQFIASNMIVTAAHCVRDSDNGGAWGRNFQFALQFDRGRSTRVYRQTCLGTPSDAYAQRPNDVAWRARDYALLLSDAPSDTGHFGWQLDWRGSYPEATAIGYPAAIEQGNVVQVVTGPLFFPNELAGMVVMREGTKGFANGASGGAFIGNFRSDGGSVGNRVISVLSARNKENPLLLGPYFDDNFKSLYEYVARGCR